MNALSALRDKVDFLKLMEHYGFKNITSDANMLRSTCAIHGGDNPTAFVVDTDTNLWYCHTGSCGGGDAYTLVQRVEECSFPEAVKIVADLSNVDIEGMEIKGDKDSYAQEVQRWAEAVRRTSNEQQRRRFELNSEVRELVKFRDFQEETLRHFRAGYVEELTQTNRKGEEYTMRKRLVVPMIENGLQVGVSLRATRKGDFPKWFHQPRNIKTSDMLYNIDGAQENSEIVVVEGPFDVWAFYEIGVEAVAVYGSHISNEQYKKLMRTGADIVFAFDGDKAGQDATEKAIQMFMYKANMSIVEFDVFEDPASIEREELKIKYGRRRLIC